MSNRKQQSAGFGKRRSQEADQRRQAQKRRNLVIYGLIGAAAVILLSAAVWWTTRPSAETPQEGGALTPVAGERPLAAVPPADRNDYYDASPAQTIDTTKTYEAAIVTDKGEMRFRLYADRSPVTVNNFVFLARQGFYDGVTFHRVLQNFMAQTGDPTGTGTGGPGYQFADETTNGLTFDRRGLLAMANAGPNTNGSQFFITFVPTPHLDGNHTIFGELIAGDDVLSAIRLRDPASDPEPGDAIRRIDIFEN